MHAVCITRLNSVAERRTQRERKRYDSMANGAFVGKIPFFIWILCHRFLEIERSKKFLEGAGKGGLQLFLGKMTS